MAEQQRKDVYLGALSSAQDELQYIQDEFDRIARRKDYLSSVVEALSPLVNATKAPADKITATALEAAPFEPAFTPARTQSADSIFTPVRSFDPSSFQQPEPQPEVIAAPAQDFFAPVQKAQPFTETPASENNFAQAAMPEQEIVLQQSNESQKTFQPASGEERIEQRINFALNFALLS